MSRAPVTAVVVAHDGGALLERCIAALLEARGIALELVVADNASSDGAPARVAALYGERVRVLPLACNRGFAGGVNAAIAATKAADPNVYVLVNQDCIVAPAALAALAAAVDAPGVGAAGGLLFEPDGITVQHAGGVVADNGLTRHLGRGARGPEAWREPCAVDYVTGALLAFRASIWTRFGPFEEAYHPVYFEEVDFCLRLRAAGLRVMYEPGAEALHHEASSSGRGSRRFLRLYHRNRMRFAARHLLRRGRIGRTLAAELSWLARQRDVSQVAPALRAYAAVPGDVIGVLRRARSSRRSRA